MNRYTARELADKLKDHGCDSISLRNIRYYREIEVLKDLIQIGKKKYFTDEHFHFLKAMHTLQKTGLSLREIKNKLEPLDMNELQNISEQMSYYTSDRLSERILESSTHMFNDDISITFSHNVPENQKCDITSMIQNYLKKQK